MGNSATNLSQNNYAQFKKICIISLEVPHCDSMGALL